MILLLILAAACTPAASETPAAAVAETAGEAAAEADHEDDYDEDHDDHDDEDHDDHDEDENRDHGAHEHGVAILTVAWSGNELAIDLETPAYNVVGFEYAPSSDEEKALLADSIAALEAGDLLQLSAAADCTVISTVVETEMRDDVHEEGEEHEDEEEGEETHADIDVSYDVQCDNPDDLTALDAGPLFDRFPNFAELDVQWISDTMQSAKELTADDPIVSFQ